MFNGRGKQKSFQSNSQHGIFQDDSHYDRSFQKPPQNKGNGFSRANTKDVTSKSSSSNFLSDDFNSTYKQDFNTSTSKAVKHNQSNTVPWQKAPSNNQFANTSIAPMSQTYDQSNFMTMKKPNVPWQQQKQQHQGGQSDMRTGGNAPWMNARQTQDPNQQIPGIFSTESNRLSSLGALAGAGAGVSRMDSMDITTEDSAPGGSSSPFYRLSSNANQRSGSGTPFVGLEQQQSQPQHQPPWKRSEGFAKTNLGTGFNSGQQTSTSTSTSPFLSMQRQIPGRGRSLGTLDSSTDAALLQLDDSLGTSSKVRLDLDLGLEADNTGEMGVESATSGTGPNRGPQAVASGPLTADPTPGTSHQLSMEDHRGVFSVLSDEPPPSIFSVDSGMPGRGTAVTFKLGFVPVKAPLSLSQ